MNFRKTTQEEIGGLLNRITKTFLPLDGNSLKIGINPPMKGMSLGNHSVVVPLSRTAGEDQHTLGLLLLEKLSVRLKLLLEDHSTKGDARAAEHRLP